MWLELGPSSSSIILVLATLQDIISYINPTSLKCLMNTKESSVSLNSCQKH